MIVSLALGDDGAMSAADLPESSLLEDMQCGAVPREGHKHHVIEAEDVECPIERQAGRFSPKAPVLLRDDDTEFSSPRNSVYTGEQRRPNRPQGVQLVNREVCLGRSGVDRLLVPRLSGFQRRDLRGAPTLHRLEVATPLQIDRNEISAQCTKANMLAANK